MTIFLSRRSTNLFDATQARAMVLYMLDGLPPDYPNEGHAVNRISKGVAWTAHMEDGDPPLNDLAGAAARFRKAHGTLLLDTLKACWDRLKSGARSAPNVLSTNSLVTDLWNVNNVDKALKSLNDWLDGREPCPMTITRDEIAEIIDPEAWGARVKTAPIFDERGKLVGERLLEYPLYALEPSFAKADAILARVTSPEQEALLEAARGTTELDRLGITANRAKHLRLALDKAARAFAAKEARDEG